MISISTYDAKAKLSALIQQVESGEEIVITRHGKPVAKLVSFDPPAWKPFAGTLPEDLLIRELSPGEDVTPLFPEGFPQTHGDPV